MEQANAQLVSEKFVLISKNINLEEQKLQLFQDYVSLESMLAKEREILDILQ